MDMSERDEVLETISEVLAVTDDAGLVKDFLLSIFTANEISEVVLRWALVDLLDRGWSQRKISSELGVSLCKITRGSKELKKDGSALKMILDKYREMGNGK